MMLRDFNQENLRFKIEVKRSDKSYPMTSQEFTKMIAPKILSAVNIQYLIDVKILRPYCRLIFVEMAFICIQNHIY